MTTVRFIGIDLAWRSESNPSGAAVLEGDCCGARLKAISTLRSSEAVLEFIGAFATEETVVTIDAPLVIVNEEGQRACETAVGKRYGNRDASCHTSNSTLFPQAASVALTGKLLADGFTHVRRLNELRTGRIIAEVYPHAAMVALFNLPKILKYKKGRVTQRREGLASLQELLRRLHKAVPPLLATPLSDELLQKDLNLLRGKDLKDYEDKLDALFCAYLGFYFWFWGWERNELFGDTESGYILNPKPPSEEQTA